MKVSLAYGSGNLEVEFPEGRTQVIAPSPQPGLPDERSAVDQALRRPTGTAPLVEQVDPNDRVCIAFTDITRATPNNRLIPWLLAHLAHVPRENITLLNQTGTHRPNTREELEHLLTPEIVRDYRVINHECTDLKSLSAVGTTHDGTPALINRNLVEADFRIITGFIEPHFFAGFSGGPKGIMPGCAGLSTVMSHHGYGPIAHPNSTFGVTEGNPLWEETRDIALRLGSSFLLNVALNDHRQITGVFAGDLIAAHTRGVEFVRKFALQKVERPFDVVVTSNSGYPLDLNLYQGVKGLSAAGRIVKDVGAIILACECREGIPHGSPYDGLLREASCPADILQRMASPGFSRAEQWQVQIQAHVQERARVYLHSALSEADALACHFTPCPDITAAVQEELTLCGPAAQVAVLPHGPLTIPFLE